MKNAPKRQFRAKKPSSKADIGLEVVHSDKFLT